jgi:distribution and morphology protein 12
MRDVLFPLSLKYSRRRNTVEHLIIHTLNIFLCDATGRTVCPSFGSKMSIDLDWNGLDNSLASLLIGILNKQLQSATRPSFIGPVEVTSFDFGSQPPEIELIDLRDIYRDFLEDDEDDPEVNGDPARSAGRTHDEDDEFEWVSRRSAGRGMAEEAPMYHHLPPHVRYGRGPASEMFASPTSPGSSFAPTGSIWNAGAGPSSSLGARPAHSEHPPTPPSRSHSCSDTRIHPTRPVPTPSSPLSFPSGIPADPVPTSAREDGAGPYTPPLSPPPPPSTDEHPNLQLHLLVSWHSDLRLTLTTSLRINYPSPLFMSLPIRLSVTGLVFNGELAVAYEGGQRIHLCVLDDLDPYGPSARRGSGSQGSTPSDPDADDAHGTKPLPVGHRLLPDIFIESELGQADKHVLKNVTRVEKFIQDVIRKTIEEELVFPNFHTLVLR